MTDANKIYSELTGITRSLGNIEGNQTGIKDDLVELKTDIKFLDKRLIIQELRTNKIYWGLGAVIGISSVVFGVIKLL